MDANLTLHQARQIALEYLNEIRASEASDLFSYQQLYSLMEQLTSQEEICGNANDFHNFAVELARENQEQLACRLIERGLRQFPKNVDLLADYLQYGISIGREAECRKVYDTLMGIPHHRWTWRGFSFCANYLLHLLNDCCESEEEMADLKETSEELSDEYIRFFPYSEEGYRTKARIYASINDDPEAELRILEQCLNLVKVCPKSALRCADIYFERGDYRKALPCIKRAVRDANQTQGSINEGYVDYLEGLCKIALLHEEPKEEARREQVLEIYAAFNAAFTEFGYEIDSSYRSVMVKKARRLRNQYHEIDIPYQFDKLIEQLDE